MLTNPHGPNCLVYFNTMSKRGLIISTVSKAWTLFKRWQWPHKSKWVSDCWWQQNSIPLRMAGNDPSSIWPWGAPCQSGVAVLSVTHAAALCQTPRMPSEMEPWLSHERRGLPGDTQGLSCRPRESPEPPWLTPLHCFHHMQTLTQTHTQTAHAHACLAHTHTVQTSQTWHVSQVQSQLSGALQNEVWEAKRCPVSSTMEHSVA